MSWVSESRFVQLDVSKAHKHHNDAWRLLRQVCAWIHPAVTLEPKYGLTDDTCSHEFWLLAFAQVTYHRVTVLSHRPVRLRFLSFLWKVPLRLVRVSWLEKREKLACLAACTCRKPCSAHS